MKMLPLLVGLFVLASLVTIIQSAHAWVRGFIGLKASGMARTERFTSVHGTIILHRIDFFSVTCTPGDWPSRRLSIATASRTTTNG